MKQKTTLFKIGFRKLSILLLLAIASLPALAQTWTQKSDMPLTGGFDGAVAFTINDKIYIGGGGLGTLFYEYDPANNEWTRKADMMGVTSYRAFCMGFAIGGKGYIGMGVDAGGIPKNDFWQYDPSNNQWAQKANFPGVARDAAGTFVINDKGYIAVGLDTGNNYTNELWEYNAVADTWLAKAPYTGGSADFPLTFSIGNKGYIVSGEYGTTETTTTYAYDQDSNSWSQKSDFTGTPRLAGVAFVINGIAYCGLGQTGYTTLLDDMYTYDPVANHWAAADTFTGPLRAWPSAAVVNSEAFMGDGFDFTGYKKDWWKYNPSSATGISNAPGGTGGIKCYPNPSKNLINVQVDDAGACNYTLYSITGQKVATGSFIKKGRIDASALMPGSYILQVVCEQSTYRLPVSVAGK